MKSLYNIVVAEYGVNVLRELKEKGYVFYENFITLNGETIVCIYNSEYDGVLLALTNSNAERTCGEYILNNLKSIANDFIGGGDAN